MTTSCGVAGRRCTWCTAKGMAILAGDGLQAEAFALLAREPRTDDPVIDTRKLRVIERIAAAAGPVGMVGGQAIDLEAVSPVPGRRRTRAARRGWARADARAQDRCDDSRLRGRRRDMAGAAEDEFAAVDEYAREIGLAFQIVDDILDVEGASVALGKTAGKDAAAGKPTYPALFGLDRSRALAQACLTRAHDALASARLSNSRLGAIADWVVRRTS